MAKSTLKVVGIKPSTLAMFEGTLAGAIGLGVAILYSLSSTFKLAAETNSVLAGMAFGLATGIVAVIVLPLAYFGIGWLIGYVHGWIFNVIAGSSGGIEFDTDK